MPSKGSNDHPPFNPRLLRVESPADARRLLSDLGTDRGGVAIMGRKMQVVVVAVDNVQARAAQILKQVMLSRGGDCATPRDIFYKTEERVRVVMMGTPAQFRQALRNLSVQPFELAELARELRSVLDSSFPEKEIKREIVAGKYPLELGGRTLVMGVVNVTPDSFSDGGRFDTFDKARARALEIAALGVDIVDVGGESTRPGSLPVSEEEEIERTAPLIESLARELEIPISIDTCKAQVARRALDAGASIVNDISGLRFDAELAAVVAERDVPVVIMHMQGTPRVMQENPTYVDVVGDILMFLRERAEEAGRSGVSPQKIIVDPGIGFGKTVEHNLEIVRRIKEFKSLGYPVMLGTSRKSFIGKVLDRSADTRVLGTAATVAFAIARGVDMVRVHDVEEMMDVVRMADAVAGKGRQIGSPVD